MCDDKDYMCRLKKARDPGVLILMIDSFLYATDAKTGKTDRLSAVMFASLNQSLNEQTDKNLTVDKR